MPLQIFVVAPSSLVTDHRPHGDGLVAFGFLRELAARGHELHVAAGRVDLAAPLPRNVHIHELRASESSRRAGRLRFMWGVRRLYRRLARSTAFDLLHQLTPVDVGVSLALAGARPPLLLGPYVPDWAPSGEGADAPVSAIGLRLKRLVRRIQQRRAAGVLLSTPAAESKLERRRPDLQVHVVPPGIDERAWRPAAEAPPACEVLFLANLEVRKGIHLLLDAFEALRAELPDARLAVAGAGPELDAVRARVRDLGADRVKLLGRLDRERAVTAMQRCDVYCLPSYGEPYGLSALEAMACAKPVVATDAGGLRHLVDEQGGRRVPPGDARALADALHELLASPPLRRAMGEHNRRMVEERYAWTRVVDRLELAYDEALGAGGPA